MRTAGWIGSVLLLFGSFEAEAVCSDSDADLVCDFEDNCSAVPNGPRELSNQADSDLDGYGNACDADFDGDLFTSGPDAAALFAGIECGTDPTCLPPPGFCELDLDGDLTSVVHDAATPLAPHPPATVGDHARFLAKFVGGAGGAPGPSGLACAGSVPCELARPVDVDGWPLVDDAGNAPDDGGRGGVAFDFRMAPHEVTNAEYVAFLNAAARSAYYDLFNPAMAGSEGGIVRTGSEGSYVYSTVAGREKLPVNFVSYLDALRFINWLHNGQRSEIAVVHLGAYDLSAGSATTRSPQARFHLPDEDQWYKAAYYDASTSSYFDQATGADQLPTCATPGAATQLANCGDVVGDATPVGSYLGSASPSGTFDQAGNVAEWTESWSGFDRVVRGGDRTSPASEVGAAARAAVDPSTESALIGFRVARALTPCDP